MMKSVLLTRGAEDNLEIISSLQQGIFKCICSPLVQYKSLQITDNIDDFSDIIITSKYAAKILTNYAKDLLLKKNIWLVGRSSVQMLQDKFEIQYVAANIEELMKQLPQGIYNKAIYFSSNEITKDLPAEIKRIIVYEVEYAKDLCQIEEIQKGINYILLYSYNTTNTLIKLFTKNNLLPILADSTVIAISEKVADNIRFFVKNVVYCDYGKPEQMLELLLNDTKYRN
jgi:uroporphyrinogen-III synthase